MQATFTLFFISESPYFVVVVVLTVVKCLVLIGKEQTCFFLKEF